MMYKIQFNFVLKKKKRKRKEEKEFQRIIFSPCRVEIKLKTSDGKQHSYSSNFIISNLSNLTNLE